LALLSIGFPAMPNYLCTIFNSGSPANPFGYSSTVLAQQCALFAIEPDPTKLQALAFSLQTTISTDLPVIPLFSNAMFQTYRIAAFPYLTGGSGPIIFYEPHPLVEVVSIQ
jgi:ABC-type transport system substrate-binding protein